MRKATITPRLISVMGTATAACSPGEHEIPLHCFASARMEGDVLEAAAAGEVMDVLTIEPVGDAIDDPAPDVFEVPRLFVDAAETSDTTDEELLNDVWVAELDSVELDSCVDVILSASDVVELIVWGGGGGGGAVAVLETSTADVGVCFVMLGLLVTDVVKYVCVAKKDDMNDGGVLDRENDSAPV